MNFIGIFCNIIVNGVDNLIGRIRGIVKVSFINGLGNLVIYYFWLDNNGLVVVIYC